MTDGPAGQKDPLPSLDPGSDISVAMAGGSSSPGLATSLLVTYTETVTAVGFSGLPSVLRFEHFHSTAKQRQI
ncbi:hypothetical protein AAFF_G00215790 [Aldrovandia affinis]|uniref:Uncharacterized protein n=1 Tax=Aldrovandia affinis TaxID=143900 RepID=A0AAD7RGZ7_9TELE|nr:hypothetical protein AAFF_G00215790 [Aldrovandia affinis]